MTGIIILAAGTSTRLGRPKQTLLYKYKSLLKHTIDAAVTAGIGPVMVVLGANEKEVYLDIQKEPVSIISNKEWNTGMASSINCGLSYFLEKKKDAENIILMVCDQPFTDENLLKKLLEVKLTTNESIVACSYNNTVGVPALFNKKHFAELLALKGDEGGKKLLLKHLDSVVSIPFTKGNIDVDTMEDYEALPD